jgi:hypothetical protein
LNGPTISKEVRLVLFKIKMKYEFKDFFLFRRGEKSIKWIPTEQERNLLICNICSSVASEVCVVSIFFCTVDSQMIKDLKEWYLTKCCRKIICCTCNLLIDIYIQTYRNMPDRRTWQVKIKPVRRCFRHIYLKVQ